MHRVWTVYVMLGVIYSWVVITSHQPDSFFQPIGPRMCNRLCSQRTGCSGCLYLTLDLSCRMVIDKSSRSGSPPPEGTCFLSVLKNSERRQAENNMTCLKGAKIYHTRNNILRCRVIQIKQNRLNNAARFQEKDLMCDKNTKFGSIRRCQSNFTDLNSNVVSTAAMPYQKYHLESNVVFCGSATMHEQKCYKFHDVSLTYEQAKTYCADRNGKIAVPKDDKDNTFLSGLRTSDNKQTWIGMQEVIPNDWRGPDNEEVTWFNWKQSEPSNGINENCARMHENGKWCDKECFARFAVICTAPFVGCGSATMHKQKCYQYYGVSVTYAQAKTFCSYRSGKIAMPKDEGDNNFLSGLRAPVNKEIWLGMTKRTPGVWTGTDNETVTWFNWKQGEPSNNFDEICARMHTSGKWLDKNCDDTFAVICTVPFVEP